MSRTRRFVPVGIQRPVRKIEPEQGSFITLSSGPTHFNQTVCCCMGSNSLRQTFWAQDTTVAQSLTRTARREGDRVHETALTALSRFSDLGIETFTYRRVQRVIAPQWFRFTGNQQTSSRSTICASRNPFPFLASFSKNRKRERKVIVLPIIARYCAVLLRSLNSIQKHESPCGSGAFGI